MKCGCKIPFKYKAKWFIKGFTFQPYNQEEADRDMKAIIEWNRAKGNCNAGYE